MRSLSFFSSSQNPSALKGVGFGVGAYLMWGCFPLFFALFDGVPAWEVLIHRVIWACGFLAIVISLLRRWSPVKAALHQPRLLGRVLICALLISFNWGLYIYAVSSHQVLQASLGYFLTPLVNIALAVVILRERINPLQTVSVALAVLAIVVQLVTLGELPWISLSLALTFGTYGLLRKQVLLDGLSGLFVETLLLLPLGLLAFGWLSASGISHFGETSRQTWLLVASGMVTAMPLLAFAGAARRLRLSTLGFLLYINPTLQFLIALFVFREPLNQMQLISFVMIWIGLLLYIWSAWQTRPGPRSPTATTPTR